MQDPIDHKSARWLTIMLPPSPVAADFWERHGGLLCLALREQGVDCRAVGAGQAPGRADSPFLPATPAELSRPEWWWDAGARNVVLFSWGLPRHTPVIRAAHAAGCRVLMRFDTDGVVSPRVHAGLSYLTSYSVFRQRGWPAPAAAPLAAFKTLLYGLVPATYDRPMLEHLEFADVVGLESELAAARIRRLLRRYSRPDLAQRVAVVPHEVTSDMRAADPATKEPRLVCVGRWDAHQKDVGLLARTLAMALAAAPSYEAVVAGSGEAHVRRALQRHAAPVLSRVRVAGPLPHAGLAALYQQARILFLSSRYESFHLASAEALCCGCSVVGPSTVPSLHTFVSHASGTLATVRSAAGLADALAVEMSAWETGERDPRAISDWAVRAYSVEAVARHIRALLSEPG